MKGILNAKEFLVTKTPEYKYWQACLCFNGLSLYESYCLFTKINEAISILSREKAKEFAIPILVRLARDHRYIVNSCVHLCEYINTRYNKVFGPSYKTHKGVSSAEVEFCEYVSKEILDLKL